jgi:hypothetical protein
MHAPALQIGGVDRPKSLIQRGAQHAFVDEIGDVVQQVVLRNHVRRLERGAGEHRFPVHGHGLALEYGDVEFAGIVDQSILALRRDDVGQRLVMLLGVGEARDQRHRRKS